MNLLFKNPETLLRMHEGPLGTYIDDYAAELCAEGYAQQSAELQIRLVADFSQWLAKRRISAAQITAAHFQPYLRSRARYRRPQRSDPATLKRLLNLLLRQGVLLNRPWLHQRPRSNWETNSVSICGKNGRSPQVR